MQISRVRSTKRKPRGFTASIRCMERALHKFSTPSSGFRVGELVKGKQARLNPSTMHGQWKRGTALTYDRQTRVGVVRLRAEAINPSIRKEEVKVVDSVVVTELQKPLTAYCRCWRSGTFPLCDGSHVKHNKATGDNVGPLLVKKS
ncbi:hypothetical protein ACLOJK_033516 [Asimina triloba]